MTKKTIRELLHKSACVASILSLLAAPAYASEVTGTVSTGVQSGDPGGVVVTAPAVSPAAGTYTSNQSVTLSASGSSSIHYTTNGTTPTCSTGTTYSSAISVTSTTTIKAISCYPNSVASSVTTATYTLQCSTTSVSNGSVASYPTCTITCNSGYSLSGNSCIASGGGGGGGGGGGSYVLPSTPIVTPVVTPVVTPTPVPEPTPVPAPTPTPAASGNVNGVQVLTNFGSESELLSVIGGSSKPTEVSKYKPLVAADAKEFKISLTPNQLMNITNFVAYGDSSASIKLGAGERRAVVRDYLETVGRADVVWTDVELLVTGQKPIKRNLPKEQAMATRALANFKLMTGHAPNFKVPAEDIAWNTLMYRIRFPRDLKLEQSGILKFKTIYNRAPSTPFEWAIVRALGYALK